MGTPRLMIVVRIEEEGTRGERDRMHREALGN
jgi:hypothetical protein